MAQIEILADVCVSCGTCLLRCPACFVLDDGRTTIRDEGARCIECGHCVSLCPADAIVHGSATAIRFADDKAQCTVSTLESLVKRRRSHRHYEDRPVPDEVLRRILDVARYAPTGVNAQEVSVRVIRTPKRIRSLSGVAVGYFDRTIRGLEAEAEACAAAGRPIPDTVERGIKRNARYRKMAASFEKGYDPIFHKAPAVLVFHAPIDAPTPRDDCIIAAQTAVLAAEAETLGSCYIGLFQRAWTSDPAVQAALNLPAGHAVYSVLILGYPLLRFHSFPERRPFETVWE